MCAPDWQQTSQTAGTDLKVQLALALGGVSDFLEANDLGDFPGLARWRLSTSLYGLMRVLALVTKSSRSRRSTMAQLFEGSSREKCLKDVPWCSRTGVFETGNYQNEAFVCSLAFLDSHDERRIPFTIDISTQM